MKYFLFRLLVAFGIMVPCAIFVRRCSAPSLKRGVSAAQNSLNPAASTPLAQNSKLTLPTVVRPQVQSLTPSTPASPDQAPPYPTGYVILGKRINIVMSDGTVRTEFDGLGPVSRNFATIGGQRCYFKPHEKFNAPQVTPSADVFPLQSVSSGLAAAPKGHSPVADAASSPSAGPEDQFYDQAQHTEERPYLKADKYGIIHLVSQPHLGP